jgi:hypothetical protein
VFLGIDAVTGARHFEEELAIVRGREEEPKTHTQTRRMRHPAVISPAVKCDLIE